MAADASPAAPSGGHGVGAAERTLWVLGVCVAVAQASDAVDLWRFGQHVVGPWTLVLPVLLAVVCLPELCTRWPSLPRTARAPLSKGKRALRLGISLIAVAGIAWFFYHHRTVRTYGDAKAIIAFVKRTIIFHKREPLSPAIYLAAFRGLRGWLHLDVRETIQLVTSVGGAFGVWALARLARRLSLGHTRLAIAGFASLVTVGAIQLFFGYIENYTLPTVCALWSLDFGVRALQSEGETRRSVLPAAGFLTAGAMIHLSVLVLTPALFFLIWRRHFRVSGGTTSAGRALRLSQRTLGLASVTVLPMTILWFIMQRVGVHRANENGFGGGDGRMFVPWSDTSGTFHLYLFLRPKHLLAIMNQQLLVSPLAAPVVALVGLPALLAGLRKRALPHWEVLVYTGLAGLAFFGLTVIWNPDLGPLRDWDLFGPAGFYLSLSAMALVCARLAPARAEALLWFIVAVNLSRTLPFILHNLGR